MEIIKVTPAIAAEVSRVYALSWKTAYQDIVPQSYLDALEEDRWAPALTGSAYESYALRSGGVIAATSTIAPAREEAMAGWGEIISLYALPEYFGKGCGKALFGYVTDWLKAQGFQKLYLWVLEENRRARAFYERQGFMPNGDRTQITIAGKTLTELRYTKSFPAFW